ncbi:hypothetical protein MIR68_004607 [Amoeboaphelidium protococcarum]|nr:hypothetical protein MIR68_004607 [Amoeboaphelidium protococcarum]
MNNVNYRVISHEGGFVPQMHLTKTVLMFTQETSSAKMRASITILCKRLYSHGKNEDKTKRQDKAEKHIRKVLKGRKIKRVDRHVLKDMVKRRLQFASDDIKLYYVLGVK